MNTARASYLAHPTPRGQHATSVAAVGLAAMVELLDRYDLVRGRYVGPPTLVDDWAVSIDRYQPADVLVVKWDHLAIVTARDTSVLEEAMSQLVDLNLRAWLRGNVLTHARALGLPTATFARPA